MAALDLAKRPFIELNICIPQPYTKHIDVTINKAINYVIKCITFAYKMEFYLNTHLLGQAICKFIEARKDYKFPRVS